MAEIEKLSAYTPDSGQAGQVKFYRKYTLTGTEKTEWIEVPVGRYGVFIEFYISFNPTGSARVLYTPVDLVDIKNTVDPDDVLYNVWPMGTVDETSVPAQNDFVSDSKAATFTAFRVECLSGTVEVKVITN